MSLTERLEMIRDTERTHFVFRINDNGIGPNLLHQVCLERGWKCYNDQNYSKMPWNLWWRTKGFPALHIHRLDKQQFINHIPHASFICRKDNLIRNLKCMKKIYGTSFDFIPDSFNLPLEYRKLLAKCKNSLNPVLNPNEEIIWICKPVGLSQGRGISLFQDPVDLVYSSNVLVQKYVKNPLLIGGYKFDLRIYVLVPSFHPLTIYIYREGLVRFSTEKFSLSNLKNRFAHLTNSSLNKLSPGYLETKDRIGAGCKWNLQQLRCYLQQTIGSDWFLWLNISSIIVLTIASQLAKIPSTINAFEFFGFDILIDSSLKPWLIEVNSNPALSIDCAIDPLVKKPMVHDMFDLLGMPVCNTGLSLYNSNNSLVKTIKPKVKSPDSANRKKQKLQQKKQRKMNSKFLHTHFPGRIHKSCQWGNGENWNNSKGKVGNWIRVFPVLSGENSRIKDTKSVNYNHRTFSTDEIKNVVFSTLTLLKIAKQVHESNPKLNNDQLYSLMKPFLLSDTQLWLPPT